MALVSPGVSLTVTDQSQYVSSAIGTVPLIVLATAQDKTINGSLATGTTEANAGMLQIFTSQRDLATALGAPVFKQTAAGTPVHGGELNEYGLMAAYSALGLGNQLYAIRADIDLTELEGTSVRPTGTVSNNTEWLDLADTTWGLYQWSADTQSFTNYIPTVITSNASLSTSSPTVGTYGNITLTSEPTPLSSIGSIGSYAVVATTTNNRVFYKGTDNAWKLLGSTQWQADIPTVTGTVSSPTFLGNTSTVISINSSNVTVTATNVSTVVSSINAAAITGVTAAVRNNKLCLFSTNASRSNGTNPDGFLKLVDWSPSAVRSVLVQAGIVALSAWNGGGVNGQTTILRSPSIQYGNFASVPAWTASDTYPRSNGSVWLKTGAIGGGSDFVIKKYNATTNTWTTQAVDIAGSEAQAIYNLDIGGGSNIGAGTIFVYQDANTYDGASDNLSAASFTPYVRTLSGPLRVSGSVPGFGSSTGTFNLYATQPGYNSYNPELSGVPYTITVSAASSASFVSGILSANIPNVTASYNTSTGVITINHLAGGSILLSKISGQPNLPYLAGFTNSVTGVRSIGGTDASNVNRMLSGFTPLSYTYSITQPTAEPMDGTHWYYSDPTAVDVMINTGTAWVGYKTLSADARGYNLTATDANGVIVAASAPLTQTDGLTALVQGDLWLNTSDLENYPNLSRWNGSTWSSIDKTDQITVNGVVFADARWDATGTTDPAIDIVTTTTSLLTSSYTDLDAPNPQLYPRGMLLFNTRRSGYNVKRYIDNYFNATSFSIATYNSATTYSAGNKVYYGATVYVATASTTGNAPTNTSYWTPLQTSAWVTASGLRNDGSPYAGHYAQRQIVVAAMQSAIDSNAQIREDQFAFSIIAAPGYPELIDNMVALNNDRANTAFVIGDTPMNLSTNIVDLTNWSTDANGTGLTTNDPYLAVYYPSGLSTDLSGNSIMVPPSHMALRTFLHSDNLSYPWFAPAGLRRGLVDNASDLGYINYTTGEFQRTGVNQSLRDALYQTNINPITILPGTGVVVWGQKTRDPIAEAMDRVNVSRLVNYVRAMLARATYGFLFEPNDKMTRDQVGAVISGALNDLVSKRGIYDYVVVCDTSNNTPDTIANNQLYIDIAIAPTKAIEFIYIPIRLVNPSTGAAGA